MKKKFTSILFLIFGFSLFAQEQELIQNQDSLALRRQYTRDSAILAAAQRVERIRDSAILYFATKLGGVSFETDQEWTVEGHGITQIWSDAVRMVGCDTLFRGGQLVYTFGTLHMAFQPACRTNPGFPGDFFSWEAVNLFGDVLCPAPWRVPTVEDFCSLNKILFDRTRCFTHKVAPERVTERFVNWMGGTFSGAPGGLNNTRLFFHGVKAFYWSQTDYDKQHAFHFTIDVHGNVQPRCLSNEKSMGFSLRCVR